MTAADIVNTYDEERLANILYLYGELKNSRKLASVIVKARSGQNIRTIGEFLEIIKPLFGREREKKELAKVFQALRIEVNQEMEALKEMLTRRKGVYRLPKKSVSAFPSTLPVFMMFFTIRSSSE